jgi:sugar lactone lactonase YvrE
MQQDSRSPKRGHRLVVTLFALAGALVGPNAGFAQQPQIVIDDKRSFPESLTSTADGTIILGSLDHGTVYRAPRGATKATPWIAAGPNGLERVLGVFAHDASNTLWLCTNSADPQGKDATLKAFDLTTTTLKGSYPFPNGGLCNDIEVMSDGTVLATDTRGGRILALKPGASALTVWGEDPKWVGIDGIALLIDGNVLFNNVRENQLVRVEAKPDGTSGTATFLELSQPISGPDGMRRLPDGRVIMVENRSGKVDLVRVEGNKATINTIKDGFNLSLTAVTVTGDTVWVIETKFVYRNDPQFKDKDPEPFGATSVPLPAR